MRCAVLGDPIAHSLSPTLHRAAYAVLGLDWSYDAVRVPAGGLAGFVSGLPAGEWRGLSLTMPLKREAPPLLTGADPWVDLTGAVNTLVIDGAQRRGLNTDVTGAVRILREQVPAPRRAVVLGGGATATSVLVALAELGLTEAVLVVRDPARVAETLAAVARHPAAPRVEVQAIDGFTPGAAVDVVVSTVPAAAQTPALVEALGGAGLVFDVVYDPWPTPLAGAAERRGQAVLSGLDLLVAQAVDQVSAMVGPWLAGRPVPAAAMRAAAEEVLAERASAGGVPGGPG